MDNIDQLECVYYPAHIPNNSAVLSILCLVFDRIHFPGTYLPKGDYDRELLRHEIDRLKALNPKTYETDILIGTLSFLECRLPLDGILVYPSTSGSIFGEKLSDKGELARAIYNANYPPRPNFEPMIGGSCSKALPGSDESIEYKELFSYQANAIKYAANNDLPLLDDGTGLKFPFQGRYKDNAPALATLLAVESIKVALPHVPILTPRELIDFRADNVKELRAFRSSMLRYARELNQQISNDGSKEELFKKAKFLVDTEISPALHDLNRDLTNPNRPWHKRMTNGITISSSVVAGFLTGGLVGQSAAQGIRDAILSEIEGKGDKQEAAKRHGLYYLLNVKTLGK